MKQKLNKILSSSNLSLIIILNILVTATSTTFCLQINEADSKIMLYGEWLPRVNEGVDFENLPNLSLEHRTIVDVSEIGGVTQHSYLSYHDERFWAMWSDGPGIEDRVGQRVKYCTSPDGLSWSEPSFLTPIPENSGPDSAIYGTRSSAGYRWIARGFWNRNGTLFALASLDEAAGYFGESLALHAFEFDNETSSWISQGVIAENTINNYPPRKLPNGDWMMSRRPYDYTSSGVGFLIGGVDGISNWIYYSAASSGQSIVPEEPMWWALPDNTLSAIYRDNQRSGNLFRSLSSDNGKTWTVPTQTNFTDATSKAFGMRLNDGRYVLISNANPERRDPLTLAVSNDGINFHSLFALQTNSWVDYPHAIEENGSLFVSFSRAKQTVEVIKIPLSELQVSNPPSTKELAAYFTFTSDSNSKIISPIASASEATLYSQLAPDGFYGVSTRNFDVFFRSDSIGETIQTAGFVEISMSSFIPELSIREIWFDYAFTGAGDFPENVGTWTLQANTGGDWYDLDDPINLSVHGIGPNHGGFNGDSRYRLALDEPLTLNGTSIRIGLNDQLSVTNEWMRIDNIKIWTERRPLAGMTATGIKPIEGGYSVTSNHLEANKYLYQLVRSPDLDFTEVLVVDGPRKASDNVEVFNDPEGSGNDSFYRVEAINE